MSSSSSSATSDGFAIVGYVPEYRYGGVDWDAVSPLLTHMILFSVEVESDGKGGLAALDRFPNPETLSKILSATSKSHTKVLFSIGGYGRSGGFSLAVQDPTHRSVLAHNIVEMVNRNHLDGVDFNWEYPQSQADWDCLFLLIKQVKSQLREHNGIVTMAYYPSQERILSHFVGAGGLEDVDLLLAMTYDQHGRHSTLQFAKSHVKAVEEAQSSNMFPVNKVCLGVPFYGRDVETGEAATFGDILKMATTGESAMLDPEKNLVGKQYFNGCDMLQKKVKLAWKHKLGGIMIWEVAQDVHPSHPQSLLSCLHAAAHNLSPETNKQEL